MNVFDLVEFKAVLPYNWNETSLVFRVSSFFLVILVTIQRYGNPKKGLVMVNKLVRWKYLGASQNV